MGHNNRPRIDRGQSQRHIGALDDATGQFIFAAFPDPKGLDLRPWHRRGRFADLVDEMEGLQAQRYGIFVAVHAFRGGKRRKAEIARIRALWCERDQPGLRLPLAPSLRIRTSPGRGHDYLLADQSDPLTAAEADTMNRVIVDQYGGDPNACDGARVLRLAGSWNMKGEPFPVEIVGGSGEVYGRQTLLDAFPVPVLEVREPVRSARIEHTDRYLQAAINGVVADLAGAASGQRNATLNRAAFRLGQLGIGTDEAASILTPTARAIGLGSHETKATIRSGATKGAAVPAQVTRRAA